jgi:hypothetical protein
LRIHEVLIVPGAGHGGAGFYDRGHVMGNMAETDVVDSYIRGIVDELDDCAVRHRIMPTRSAPGVPLDQRHQNIMPHSLILSCHVGWFKASPSKMPTNNLSRVFYGARELFGLAKQVSEAVGHWGQLYGGFSHRGAAACADQENPLLNAAGTWGLRLEPFALNGPNALDYCKRLEQLGRDIGRVLTNYLINRDEGRAKPSTLDTYVPQRKF